MIKTFGISYLSHLIFFLLLLIPGASISAEHMVISFAFSDIDPPTSYMDEEGNAVGLLPELVDLAFELIPDFEVSLNAYPWTRAKLRVELGQNDGLFTYPGKSVSEYAGFTDMPAYILDYNYIFYPVDHEDVEKLSAAETVRDLKPFVLITTSRPDNLSWEENNLPNDEFQRVFVNNIETAFNLLLVRREGDFLVRNPEEGMYLAREMGYEDKLLFRRIQFPSENSIPFHFGIRRSHPQYDRIMSELNRVVESKEFQDKAEALISSYQ